MWTSLRPLLSRLADDFRVDTAYALRKMRSAPMFTTVVLATLAVAIGANVAVFSAIDAVLLRMLPVERPHELRELGWIDRREAPLKVAYSGGMRPLSGDQHLATSFAYPVYTHVRDRSTVFADLFLFERRAIDVTAAASRQRMAGLLVSGNFLQALGVTMAAGRPMTAEDDRSGAPPTVVLTHAYWQRAFGGSPDAIGQTISLKGASAVVIGVTSHGFDGLEPGTPVDAMLPINALVPILDTNSSDLANVRRWRFQVMGRIRDGIDDRRAQAETETLVRQVVAADIPGAATGQPLSVVVMPGGQGLGSLRRNLERPLYLLMALMAVVLLIACSNIAGLLLTRATAREQEIGVRLALGAGRARLGRQLLTESSLLALAGGALGVGLGLVVRDGLLAVLNDGRAPAIDAAVNPRLLIVSIVLCLAVGIACGLLPALRTRRVSLNAGRVVPGATAGGPYFGGAKALIALQVALSLLLLVGAGLFTRTLINLRAQPIGFQPDRILLFELDAAAGGYEGSRRDEFYERSLESVAAIPDVRSVSLSRCALLSGGRTTDTIVIPDAPAGQNEVRVHLQFVSPGYLDTMGIPLLSGRLFDGTDRTGAPRVALANQALVKLLPGTGAGVGSRILYARPDSPVEIVGITADARLATLREPAPPTLYLPYRQYSQSRMTVAVRTGSDAAPPVAAIRRALATIDPEVPLLAIRTQRAQMDDAVLRERVFAYVALAFAGLALGLAALGIYGAVSYSVTRRTREIGVRLALGARRWQVMVMTIRESLLPVLLGLACGLGGVAMTTRFIQSMLFGLTPHDVPTIAAATLGLAVSALLAAWLPSRRASAVDPMMALRSEP